ncbi:signal peptidase I [Micromonospora arida]|uniref:Signal peptidase I n=3 Tax=Micromonospora TaxID=1873 RepID=A0A328N2F5_9ACTN|nr:MULTISPECIES: signal peptidase I [Micromonospora]MBM0207488.1 signal peptidase I [Micromonospora sp. STR1s_5]KAB1919079.1 signal peptidase I [Micromonospora noduli]RAN94798.1 Signal peptidase I [Micromonospora noduli]RAO05842.1 Signal peptidase I [Micromonospora noduli]RAO18170.1 Signal peptidase I [Micromonospora noduli]
MIDEQTDKPRSSFWKELPILLGVAILVAVLVRAFVLQTFFIPSPSMENTLKIDDRVLVNKLVYDFRSPHRGEVIVFKAPTAWSGNPDGEDFIKRVIGIPGDHVVCCDPEERLMINGKSLDEPYIFSMDGIRDKPADQEFDITVPEGRLWVMGDHRSASGDSLEHWQQSQQNITEATIPEDDVVGRAFTVFWPVSRATWLTVPDGFDGIPKP